LTSKRLALTVAKMGVTSVRSLPAVLARLGHADTNVTARIYSHALSADDQPVADVWDSIVGTKVQ